MLPPGTSIAEGEVTHVMRVYRLSKRNHIHGRTSQMSKLVRSILVLSLLVLIALPAVASHSWNGYHWARTSNPISLKLGDNVDSRWDAYLLEAASDWHASSVLNVSVIAGSTNPRRCTPDTGEIEVCNASYGNTGWLGVAGVWVSGKHITKAYTKLNDTYFDTAKYNTPEWRRMVTCQEIGHDFGLGHQDENFNNVNLGSCMDYTNAPGGGTVNGFNYGASNEHPNAHDYDQLEADYGHGDSASLLRTIVASSLRPKSMAEILADADQWGTAIRFDAHGRPILFAHKIGANENGEPMVVYTHVLWADDAAGTGRNHHE